MKLTSTISETRSLIKSLRNNGKSLGFVPTMGALHKGHLSLVKRSREENDITVVSIFINPTQFNEKQDFKSYPRNLEEDLDILRPLDIDLVFSPDEKEIYPEPDVRIFDFGGLDNIMEGKHRPGHFNGVAQVVSKFFQIVEPDVAYFGEKDFQQLAIIRIMIENMGIPLQVRGCPIIREFDGLAMSSRNKLLTASERKTAARISEALYFAVDKAGRQPVKDIIDETLEFLKNFPEIETEYFDIVDERDLKSVSDWSGDHRKRGCIAAKIGKVRLIDNMDFSL